MKNPEEIKIKERINKKLFLLFTVQILIIVSVVLIFVFLKNKEIQIVYNEHTTDFANPIKKLNSSDAKLYGDKLFEENYIIVMLQKIFYLTAGENLYLNELSLYTTPNFNRYYKKNISTKSFWEGVVYNRNLLEITRRIRVKNIKELSGRIQTDGKKIKKAYELEIEIVEYIISENEGEKEFVTPAQINLTIGYHDENIIPNFVKFNKNYPIINPLNLKIYNIFITT